MRRRHRILHVLALVAAVCAAGYGACQWFVLAPDETDRMRDDAFYEFAWAANLALGNGPTVSDGVWTSGVQYLWSLLLVPVVWLAGAAALPMIAGWLGFALHVANAALWYRLARDRFAGLCLALCWFGHPLLFREAQNGQETALATLLATVVFALRRAPGRWFQPACLLAVFARADLLALVVCMHFCRNKERPVGALGGVLVAIAVPSLVNLLLGGGMLQDSAMPMSWLFHSNLAAVPDTGFWQHQWWFTRPALLGGPYATASAFGFGFLAFLLVRPWWPVGLRVVPAVAVGVASGLGVRDLMVPGWCALLLALFPSLKLRRLSCERMAVVFGLAAIVVLHWPLRWYPRDYYLAPLVVVAFAAIARFGRFRLLLLVFALLQLQDSGRIQAEPLAGQAEMRMAGRFLHRILPAGERVGCFNSGLVTFEADVLAAGGRRHGIVNLDGVVDRRSFAALQQGRLDAFLDAEGVRYLLDHPVQFSLDPSLPHACGRYFGDGFEPARDLVEVARFDVPSARDAHGDSMRLYLRRGGRLELASEYVVLDTDPDGTVYAMVSVAAGESVAIEPPAGGMKVLATPAVSTRLVLAIAPELGFRGVLTVGGRRVELDGPR